jgi:hypothetical protein
MSKASRISPSVRSIIYKAALDEKEKDRRLLAVEIQEKLSKLDIRAIPVEETLQKMISWARNNSNDPEDSPWSVSALADYDIPAVALPVVMNAWAKALVEDKPITIRQVKWVARLYCILGNIDGLIIKALEYANREKAIKLTGTYPDKPQNMRHLWFGDAFLYLDMKDKDIELAKRVMKMYGFKYEVKKNRADN